MQPARHRFALERDRHRLDPVIGEPRIAGEALLLLLVQLDMLRPGIVVGPLGGTVVDGGHVPVVARGDGIAFGFRCARLGLAAPRCTFEGGADIRHLLHPGADRGEIGIRLHPARRGKIDRARLVPVDSVCANDIVDGPALLREAPGHGCGLGLGERRAARGEKSRARAQAGNRADEATSIHGDLPLDCNFVLVPLAASGFASERPMHVEVQP